MNETEATYTIPEPTLAQQVHALAREVEHVTEQMQVVYAQIAHWKARAIAAEHALETSQRAQGRTNSKPGLSGRGQTSDGLHGSSDALEA